MSTAAKTILIADDDFDDQEILEEAFRSADDGVSIVKVSSAEEAFDYLDKAAQKPSLIVVDYNMPSMSGASMIEFLCSKREYAAIPSVVWSTSNSAKYEKICAEKGARAYFQKPSRFEEIVDIARKMLNFLSREAT